MRSLRRRCQRNTWKSSTTTTSSTTSTSSPATAGSSVRSWRPACTPTTSTRADIPGRSWRRCRTWRRNDVTGRNSKPAVSKCSSRWLYRLRRPLGLRFASVISGIKRHPRYYGRPNTMSRGHKVLLELLVFESSVVRWRWCGFRFTIIYHHTVCIYLNAVRTIQLK